MPGVDIKETLRYLGYQNNAPSADVLQIVHEIAGELESCATPKSVYKLASCDAAENEVTLENIRIPGKHLAKNLAGCREAVIFAATLGPAVDTLMKRYEILNLAKAAIVQAAGAALIESVCDELEASIRADAAARCLSLRPRFSPGYGDFLLEHQRALLQVLEADRRIGLTLTDTLLMIPSKSVSAVIGLSETICEPVRPAKCVRCAKTDCAFRMREDSKTEG